MQALYPLHQNANDKISDLTYLSIEMGRLIPFNIKVLTEHTTK